MNKFKDLKVWQKAMQLVINIYSATSSFPQEEIYGIISQIRRSAVSILSNIAEGAGRSTQKEFAHFLSIAQGSSFEHETQLIISRKLNFINELSFESLTAKLDKIQKMITGLQKTLS